MESKYQQRFKIAKYYYNDGLTQQEIANKLNLSRPTVSNALKKAKEEGIIQIRVVDIKNNAGSVDLERELKKSFGLKDVILADCNYENYDRLLKCIGTTAAMYLEDIFKDDLKIGISWGSTLKEVIKNLSKDKKINNLEVVTLVGGSGKLKPEVHSNILSHKIINKYNGTGHFLYAPAVVDKKKTWRSLIENNEIKKILKKAKMVDIALVGIGAPTDVSNLVETGYYSEEQIKEMKEQGIVGDICSRFYNDQGQIYDLETMKYTIGISIEDLKKINKVIGIAGGKEKVRSILGALRGNLIDVLITDVNTANLILDKK
jgi:deoxyribonucleoside regulator